GPLYHSEGMVRIAWVLPTVLEQTDQNQPIPMFDSFMQAQQELLTSRAMLEAALRDPMWVARGIGNRRPKVPAMAVNLKVDVKPRSENLRISYDDPNAAVASTAVASTITAYQNVFEKDNQKLDHQRLELLQQYRTTLTSQLSAVTNPPSVSKPEAPPTAVIPPPPQYEMPSAAKVAMVDPQMSRLIDRCNDARDQLEQASAEFGPNHPYVQRLSRAYDISSQRVDQYLSDYVSLHAAIGYSAVATPTASVGSVLLPPPPPQNPSVQQATEELDRVNRRIEALKTEEAMPKRFEIVDIGDLPVHLPNKQIKWTISGAGAGVGLVLGIMVLLGMSNRRYRVCAEVIETMGRRVRFVTAVPNLGTSSKSRYIDDAAQSIHHFRHRLEQNGAVYMVTGADRGEGRTSIVMSLAVSLCGSGARTLVIDADLETRGLTRALKMEDHAGFVEIVRNGQITVPANMPSNGIAVLPAGAATEGEGVLISASALARLFASLKSEFDVILIDTGPTPMRIEASMMARQVNGILLTMCRGQDQSMWDQTLEELESVGTICGAVFNRADPKDFNRSARRRSRGHANERLRPIAGPLANMGPLVSAVAFSLTQDIELFPITGEVNADTRKVA
ncbi:MAG TPA: division plane positioning ATPase MipZ, partial [Tepidisphaeraceae bacterium]